MYLFEIRNELRAILARMDEEADPETGEVPAELEAAFEALEADSDEKLRAYAAVYKELEADKESAHKERQRIAAIEQRIGKSMDRLLDRIADAVPVEDAVQRTKTRRTVLSDPILPIEYAASQRVEVHDMDKLPADLVRVIPERREPDKAAIKAALKYDYVAAALTDVVEIRTIHKLRIG